MDFQKINLLCKNINKDISFEEKIKMAFQLFYEENIEYVENAFSLYITNNYVPIEKIVSNNPEVELNFDINLIIQFLENQKTLMGDFNHFYNIDSLLVVPLIKADKNLIGILIVKLRKENIDFSFFNNINHVFTNILNNHILTINNIEKDIVLNSLDLVIIILNSKNIIEYANSAFLDICLEKNFLGKDLFSFEFGSMSILFNILKENLSNKKLGKTEVTFNEKNIKISRKWLILNIEEFDGKKIITIDDITEQKLSEKKLRDSEELFKGIIQNINEYVYSVEYIDGVTVSVYHSPQCVEVTGYSHEDFDKNSFLWYDMIYEEDKEKVHNFLMELSATKERSQLEHRIICKDGTIKWVSNICSVKKNNKGEIVRQDGYILDITKQVDTISELQKLYQAVEQSPSTVIITNIKGSIEYVNPKFTELTGYDSSDVIGCNPKILKSGSTHDEVYEDMWKTILAGNDWHGEFYNKKKNGEFYWEEAWISPLRNSAGKVTHFIAVKEDITNRKAAEKALKISETKLRIRNDMIEKELKYAKRVTMALLPSSVPKLDHLHINYHVRPLEEIGGDFFDFYQDGQNLGLFLGDVAGHGVSAALFLSLLKYTAQSVGENCYSQPGLFIAKLNNTLVNIMPNYFITAFYCYFKQIDSTFYSFRYSSGGHPPLIYQKANNGDIEMLSVKGTIVGMFENSNYEEKEILMEKGDRVYLYTDGIPEAMDENNNIIGFDQVADIVKASWSESIKTSIDNIINKVKSHCGTKEIEDDIIIIGVEIV